MNTKFVDCAKAILKSLIIFNRSYSITTEPTEYDEQIEERQQQTMELIEDGTKSECADEVLDKECHILSDEIKEL